MVAIEEHSVTVESDGKEDTISPVDQVVLAVGMKPCNDLKKNLRDKGVRHTVVGDAFEVRSIIEATEKGARAAWEI